MDTIRIGIILGSTRPGRLGDQVARWALDQAKRRTDAEFELIDLADFPLPHLDEPVHPSKGQYSKEHTKVWSATIDKFDGYVFVTPEYNHAPSGVLKNALDYLYGEWNNKSAGIVSYGDAAAGARAAELLRLILGELQIADVRQGVAFSLAHDFREYRVFAPRPEHERMLRTQLDQVIAWATALRNVRLPQVVVP